mgnify:FL=1
MKKLLIGLVLLVAAAAGTLYLSPSTLLATVQFAERQMAGLSARQVQVGEFTIHYYEGGPADAPTLLLIHGFGADKDNWLRFSRPLTANYHVIALDLPGFGQSSKIANAPYDLNAQVARLEAVVRQLGLKQVNVVGNSMGGQLAAMFAARYPEQVRSVALFANAGITSPNKSELQSIIERGEPNPLIVTNAEDFERLMAFVFVKQPSMPAPLKQLFAERAIASHDFNQKVFEQLMTPLLALEPELGKIQAPTLLLWGDQDRLLDVSSIEVMKPLLKQSSAVVMQDCGHVPMVERPEETAGHYLAFLDGLNY